MLDEFRFEIDGGDRLLRTGSRSAARLFTDVVTGSNTPFGPRGRAHGPAAGAIKDLLQKGRLFAVFPTLLGLAVLVPLAVHPFPYCRVDDRLLLTRKHNSL